MRAKSKTHTGVSLALPMDDVVYGDYHGGGRGMTSVVRANSDVVGESAEAVVATVCIDEVEAVDRA